MANKDIAQDILGAITEGKLDKVQELLSKGALAARDSFPAMFPTLRHSRIQ
ncbi:MAG TPA: hypothetical protein VKM94_16860 [Blastocatellia bacterium]|nr:hypothetical protein [Blastocatellia bacterium]